MKCVDVIDPIGNRARFEMEKPKDIDDYISWCPVEVQDILQQVRETIRDSMESWFTLQLGRSTSVRTRQSQAMRRLK